MPAPAANSVRIFGGTAATTGALSLQAGLAFLQEAGAEAQLALALESVGEAFEPSTVRWVIELMAGWLSTKP